MRTPSLLPLAIFVAVAASFPGLGCKEKGSDAAVANDVEFAGRYSKTDSFTMKAGRRTQSGTRDAKGSITVGNGKVVYELFYAASDNPSAKVTQTYSYKAEGVKKVSGGFDVPLTFVGMDANTKNYSPDKNNPNLQARRRGTTGWQIGLTITDDNGVFAGIEFQ